MQGKDLSVWIGQHPVVLVPGYVLFWCVMSYLVGAMSGWARFYRNFPADHVPTGQLIKWRTLMIGSFSHYGNCINVIISPEGLFLRPAALFYLGHPPLLIPWSNVTAITQVRAIKASYKVEMKLDGTSVHLYLPVQAKSLLDQYVKR